MLVETFARGAQLLHFLLRFVGFSLEYDEGTGELVGHFRAAAVELFLPAAEFLEFALLFLDLLLLALELKQLLLRPLHLRIDLLGGDAVVFFVEFQHRIRGAVFGHVWSRRRGRPRVARPLLADSNCRLGECEIFPWKRRRAGDFFSAPNDRASSRA